MLPFYEGLFRRLAPNCAYDLGELRHMVPSDEGLFSRLEPDCTSRLRAFVPELQDLGDPFRVSSDFILIFITTPNSAFAR